MVIKVGRLWRCFVLIEGTNMSIVLLSLSLSMFAVAKVLTSPISFNASYPENLSSAIHIKIHENEKK